MIFGIGMDIVAVARIQRLLEEKGERFKKRLFTDDEMRYCDAMPTPSLHYSARFAAKEAYVKALGTGFTQGASWREIGIVHRPGGQPEVVLTGKTLELHRLRGAGTMHVSLTHTADNGGACVVIERA